MERQCCYLLTRLPRELRDRIYSEALVADEDINIENLESEHSWYEHEFPEPSLLHTCKDIREEALEIYYGNNTFRAIVFDEDSTPPLRWLRSLDPAGRRAVRNLIIEYQISPGIRRQFNDDKHRSRRGDVRAAVRATLDYHHGNVPRCKQFLEGLATLEDFDTNAIKLATGRPDSETIIEHRKYHWKVEVERFLMLGKGVAIKDEWR